MRRSALLAVLTTLIILGDLTVSTSEAADTSPSAAKWKISSIEICRSSSGSVYPTVKVIGSYPVYSFFIPRPVWTVNGTVVESNPIYDHGKLVAFQLFNITHLLEPGTKNTIKFALPDHSGSRVFLYDHSRIPAGQCFEFF